MSFKRAFITLMALMLLPGLALAQGGDVTARFEVHKTWLDGDLGINNIATPVDVNITCTTGLPLSQDATITAFDPVEFVVGDLLSLEDVDCVVTETVPAGYDPEYFANEIDVDPGEGNDLGCFFKGGEVGNVIGEFNECVINNRPDPVDVVVYTDWDVINEGGDDVIQATGIWIFCNAPIIEGVEGEGDYLGVWSYYEDTIGDSVVDVHVLPAIDGSRCWANDGVTSSAVERTSTCGSMDRPGMSVAPGVGDSCGFTYTVFFEGIPTLSQYGLAIMALLMLGVGFVGFRRFV